MIGNKYTTSEIELQEMVSDAMTSMAGSGFMDVYLNDSMEEFSVVIQNITSLVEESIRTNPSKSKKEITRLEKICEFLKQEISNLD